MLCLRKLGLLHIAAQKAWLDKVRLPMPSPIAVRSKNKDLLEKLPLDYTASLMNFNESTEAIRFERSIRAKRENRCDQRVKKAHFTMP
jgi:hypothetical protein